MKSLWRSLLPLLLVVRFAAFVTACKNRTPKLTGKWSGNSDLSTQMARAPGSLQMQNASIAVLLAVPGVYGVLSFAVSQRTREFGVRLCWARTASQSSVSFCCEAARQIAVGVACGIALAVPVVLAFAHLIKGSPFPFRSFDASAYGIAAGLLVAVSLAAMYVPALRATQVDPMDALRTE